MSENLDAPKNITESIQLLGNETENSYRNKKLPVSMDQSPVKSNCNEAEKTSAIFPSEMVLLKQEKNLRPNNSSLQIDKQPVTLNELIFCENFVQEMCPVLLESNYNDASSQSDPDQDETEIPKSNNIVKSINVDSMDLAGKRDGKKSQNMGRIQGYLEKSGERGIKLALQNGIFVERFGSKEDLVPRPQDQPIRDPKSAKPSNITTEKDSKDDEDEIEVIIPPPKPAPPIIDLFDGEESGENVSAIPSSSCSRSPIKTKMCKVEIRDLKTHSWWGPRIRWNLLGGDQKWMSC